MAEARTDRLRIDKWLWFARFLRTRSKAAAFVADGYARVNGQRVSDPARPLRPGDVLTLALEGRTIVVRVVTLPGHRGPFEEARLAYEIVEGTASRSDRG